MRIKKNFVLRNIADTWTVIPLAEETVNFSGLMTLNETGMMIWQALEQGSSKEALVELLVSEYEVSHEQAGNDVQDFLDKLTQAGCIEE